MEWSNHKLLDLIDLYKNKPRLWDRTHDEYKIRSKKHDDWADIGREMDCDPLEARRKIESLLASFRRERQRQDCKSGSGTHERYQSKWFAFKSMTFLLHKFKRRHTQDTFIFDDNTELDTDSQDPIDDPIQIPESSPPKKTFKPTVKKNSRHKRKFSQREDQVEKVHKTKQQHNERDSSTIFGEHVAFKHRGYSKYTRNMIEKLIADILFDADMGKYDPGNVKQQAESPEYANSNNFAEAKLYDEPYTYSPEPQSPVN